MPRRANWFGLKKSGVVCVLLATVAVSFDSPAQAECITQLNQQAPEGTHWSLHYDRVKNRRCWILVDATGQELSTVQEQPDASPTLSSLQTFFTNITGIQRAPQQAQEAAPSPPRKPQAHLANANRADRPVRTEQKNDAHAAKHELTPPERDALFEEFLRWHESQQITGTGKPPASR
jgi:hypothetical protein